MNSFDFVLESNCIEGIIRPPTSKEIDAFEAFLELDEIHVEDLENFVNICEPGAKLRDKVGMDVYVGDHCPPPGGPKIREDLEGKLNSWCAGRDDCSADIVYTAHQMYETLHPFMDGNGRSGRMLWWWMMRKNSMAQKLGFLHMWYYQSLKNGQK